MLVNDKRRQLGEAQTAMPMSIVLPVSERGPGAERWAGIREAVLIGVVVSVGTTLTLRLIDRWFGGKS